jgi:hypothetical protein
LGICIFAKKVVHLQGILNTKTMKRIASFVLAALMLNNIWACTSFIISGKATLSGKPLMFKHRDTGELNNRIAQFQGPTYSFIGLVNSPCLDGEVWAGMNEAGFCIMNTASYNIREDSLKCPMDREGELMYHALGICATLEDFEAWLNSYPQPWGVEANFGVIDAQGGAAYYEMNNHRWIKYDVNEEANGYRVVTNFSFAGRYEDYEGWERYQTASAIMQENFSREREFSAIDAINLFSRKYRHEVLGVNYNQENAPKYIVDQDYIPRRITSAVICFQGVNMGSDPKYSVMWSALGYPACAVAIPLLMNSNSLPAYMVARNPKAKNGEALHSEMCDASLKIKDTWAFPMHISNGKRYVALQTILVDNENKPSLVTCTNNVEAKIQSDFLPLYQQWVEGNMDDKTFYKWYQQSSKNWMKYYYSAFVPYNQ